METEFEEIGSEKDERIPESLIAQLFTMQDEWGIYAHPTDDLILNANEDNIQPVVSIVGPTVSGKSKIVQSLKTSSQPRPILNGEVDSKDGVEMPQTGDINLFWGDVSLGNGSPLPRPFILLDSEGQFAQQKPNEVKKREQWVRKAASRIVRSIQVSTQISSQGGKERIPRYKAVDSLYPRLLYAISDVIIYVSRCSLKDTSSLNAILEFSKAATQNIKGVHCPSTLIVVQNFATRGDLRTYPSKVTTRKVAQQFSRKEGDEFESTWSLLSSYYKNIEVVLLPEFFPQFSDEDPWPYEDCLPRNGQRWVHFAQVLNHALCDVYETKSKERDSLTGRNWFKFLAFMCSRMKMDKTIDIDEMRWEHEIGMNKCASVVFRMINASLKRPERGKQKDQRFHFNAYKKVRLAGLRHLLSMFKLCKTSDKLLSSMSREEDIQKIFSSAFQQYWDCTGARRPCTAIRNPLPFIKQECSCEAGFHHHGHMAITTRFSVLSNRWEGEYECPEEEEIQESSNEPSPKLDHEGNKIPFDSPSLQTFMARKELFLQELIDSDDMEIESGSSVSIEEKCLSRAVMTLTELVQAINEMRNDVGLEPVDLYQDVLCKICGLRAPGFVLECRCHFCEVCVDYLTRLKLSCPIHETNCEPGTWVDRVPSHLLNFPPSTVNLRILSLDGGGVRGLSSALILEHIENAVSEILGMRVFARDLFDIVVGTSTGGIIIAAAYSGIPMEQMVPMYEELSKDIFWTSSTLLLALTSYSHYKLCEYVHSQLRSATRACFPLWAVTATGSQNNRFSRNILGTAVPSQSLNSPASFDPNAQVRHFYTNELPHAVRATTAAPPYFEPSFLLGWNDPLVDGGLWANNPSVQSMTLASKIGEELFADRNGILVLGDPYVTLCEETDCWKNIDHLCSIGTGMSAGSKVPGSMGGWGLAQGLINEATNTITAHLEMEEKYGGQNNSQQVRRYFRLDVKDIGELHFGDSTEPTIQRLKTATAEFLGEENLQLKEIISRSVSCLFYASQVHCSQGECTIKVAFRLEDVNSTFWSLRNDLRFEVTKTPIGPHRSNFVQVDEVREIPIQKPTSQPGGIIFAIRFPLVNVHRYQVSIFLLINKRKFPISASPFFFTVFAPEDMPE